MKLKRDLVLRQVADTWVVLALTAANVDLNNMLKLNETGAMLWRVLEQGGDLDAMADALTAEYAVSREQALADAAGFYAVLVKHGYAEAE